MAQDFGIKNLFLEVLETCLLFWPQEKILHDDNDLFIFLVDKIVRSLRDLSTKNIDL